MSASKIVTVNRREPLPDANSDDLSRIDRSVALAKEGDTAVVQGDWLQTAAKYQQALNLWPHNRNALYGLGRCADFNGNAASVINYYRICIYFNSPSAFETVPGDGYRESNVTKLMKYVLPESAEGSAIYGRDG